MVLVVPGQAMSVTSSLEVTTQRVDFIACTLYCPIGNLLSDVRKNWQRYHCRVQLPVATFAIDATACKLPSRHAK